MGILIDNHNLFMNIPEVEILLIEENMDEAEKAIDIFRNNNSSKKLIHLRNGKEANDFIFCKGVFSKRNIQNQPKLILFNINVQRPHDTKFLNRISSDKRTKNISLIVICSKQAEENMSEEMQPYKQLKLMGT